MRFIIILSIIVIIFIIYNSNYSDYPNNLNNYVIYGKLDKKDKKTYHYQFKKNIYYKINKYGSVIKKGNFTFKRKGKRITLNIDKKQFTMGIIPTKKKYVFYCKNKERKVLLIKIQKKKYIKDLEGKIIQFTNLVTDKKSNKLKYQEYTNYYYKDTYTKFNPFINERKKYNYYINDYGKAYLMLENSFIKMLFKSYNEGNFILKSGDRIIEGNFKILN